ncbi:unnamed protein product, partial [Owenia fusiformis]
RIFIVSALLLLFVLGVVSEKYTVLVKRVNGTDSNQTITVNTKKGTIEIDDPTQDMYVFKDFKMGFSVVRTHIGEKYGCFLNPMRGNEMTPQALESYLESQPDGELSVEPPDDDADDPKMMPAERSVKNKRLLPKSARKACDKLPIYWMVPVSDDELLNEDEADDKYGRGCRFGCWIRWTGWGRYWYCGITCSWGRK